MNIQKLTLSVLLCSLIFFFPRNIFSDDIKKADKYYEQLDYKLAVDIYEKVMAKNPSPETAEKLANCYRFINNSEEAEKAYARLLTFSGFNPINYKYYGEALKQNGKFEEAKQSFLLYKENVPAAAQEAEMLANSCDAARIWFQNPDLTVQINPENKLNSPYSEFSPVKVDNILFFVSDRWFVQDGNSKKDEVYGWTGNPYLKMYSFDAGSSKLDILSKTINSDYHNGPAVFTASGDTMYFTRTDLPEKKKRRQISVIKKTIWMSVKKGADWSSPVKLPFNNEDAFSVQHPALSPDGSILYFASDMPGGFGGMDIYAVKKQADGSWSAPLNCGASINSAEDDVFPYVRIDGRFYFSSKGHIGMGGLDIFTSEGSYNSFSPAENLKAPMNSPKDDFGVLFEDQMNGYLSSNRNGGQGLDDIYHFQIVPAKPVFAISGEVIDKKTRAVLNNINIVLLNKTTGEVQHTISDLEGKFSFDLKPGMDYVVSGDKDKYYSGQEGLISTKNLKESTIFSVKFELERSEDAYLVKLNNIYYDFDKWNIRKDAVNELNKVVSFLNTMPNVVIELRAHTDSRGSAVYNQWLSQKRAESASDYLKEQGVPGSRLTATGLGESQLVNNCGDGIKCTEAQHSLNRRTEFKVIKVDPVLSMAGTNNKK